MRIVYAGHAGTAHTEAWLGFLTELGQASFIDIDMLATASMDGFDLLVVDAAWNHAVPDGLTLAQLGLPTVLVGTYGVRVGDALHLKFGSNYGCMCLHEDAIAWDDAHPAFAGLADAIEAKAPPSNFAAFSAILDVPALVPALQVLSEPIDEPGQVTVGFGFLDSPECEIIAGGFNDKTQAHFAIARQGRFLQWGFSGSPSQYTPQGRALLANCLRYLAPFADDPVREFRTSAPRQVLRMLLSMEGWRGIGLPAEMSALMMEKYLRMQFAGEVPAAGHRGRQELMSWLDAHMRYLRNDGVGWLVDVDAQALGLAIDDLALLDACLATPDERAARLWQRYTGRALADVARERVWLGWHRAHLYFTDWGGYRWVSMLDAPNPVLPATTPVLAEAGALLSAARYGDTIKAILLLELPPGFHAYAPGSSDGLPLTLSPGPGFEWLDEPQLESFDGHLSGEVSAMLTMHGTGDELAVSVRLQLCDSLTCLMPQTLELRCQIQNGA